VSICLAHAGLLRLVDWSGALPGGTAGLLVATGAVDQRGELGAVDELHGAAGYEVLDL
jgi:hypothetical protein